MKTSELSVKTKAELNEILSSLLNEQFQLRMRKAYTQNPKTHLFLKLRKEIARVKTILNQN